MICKRACRLFAVRAAFAFACLLGLSPPASAQAGTKPAIEKWQPKDGLYASPRKDFAGQCGEYGDIIIGLAEKSISGHEWDCEITKRTDTAPDAIKLNMTCDYNLAATLFPRDPEGEDKKFKEVLILKKTDEKSISVRRTLNGKFNGPSWRADYCPQEWQRSYIESRAREKAEARPKAAKINPWRPQAGVYAAPGADFNDRCVKSGDAIIDLSERLISSGVHTCNVTFVRNQENALLVFATCTSGTPDPFGSIAPKPESILVSKIDDKTIILHMLRQQKFIDQQLSYCGPEAQKMYAQQKARK